MKTTKEKILVMQAYEDGEEIEKNWHSQESWVNDQYPSWDWGSFKYRIKPKEPEIDWSKVAMDTPVLVRNSESDQWKKRYFSHKNGHGFNVFGGGCTSRTKKGHVNYNHCMIDLEVKSIINWIPNTGVKPDCKYVIARLKSGEIAYPTDTESLVFLLDISEKSIIKEYAIIE